MREPLTYRETTFPSGAVESAWSLDVARDAVGLAPYLVLPDGSLDLLHRASFDADGRLTRSELIVVGAFDRPNRVEILPGERFAGLRFRPGWGGVALGLAPTEIAGQLVDAPEASRELGRLAALVTDHPASALAMLLGWFRAREPEGPPGRALAAIGLLRAGGGRTSVQDVARRLDISPRTLRREVAATAGLSPKSLARIFRFRRALALRADARHGLAEIAERSGYADQAHMTRDFRDLGGFTPAAVPDRLTT